MKKGPHILQWVAAWLLAVLLGSVFYSTAAAQTARGGNTPQQVHVCKRKLARQVTGVYMSSTTANRIALRLCQKLRDGNTEERYFFRALTSRP